MKKEQRHIRIYNRSIDYIHSFGKDAFSVMAIWSFMMPLNSNNVVHITNDGLEYIRKKCRMSKIRFNASMLTIHRAGIMICIDNNHFLANPHLYMSDNLRGIRKLRSKFALNEKGIYKYTSGNVALVG